MKYSAGDTLIGAILLARAMWSEAYPYLWVYYYPTTGEYIVSRVVLHPPKYWLVMPYDRTMRDMSQEQLWDLVLHWVDDHKRCHSVLTDRLQEEATELWETL